MSVTERNVWHVIETNTSGSDVDLIICVVKFLDDFVRTLGC